MYSPLSPPSNTQVDEFHAKMKPVFKKIRPRDFKDPDPNAKLDWNDVIEESERQRTTKK
jgi:hypothetical protein